MSSYGKIGLLEGFERGSLSHVKFLTGETIRPPKGKKWLILSGTIGHITGSCTTLYVKKRDAIAPDQTYWSTSIPLAAPTDTYPIFNNALEQGVGSPLGSNFAQYSMVFIDDILELYLTSGAGGVCYLTVLEW